MENNSKRKAKENSSIAKKTPKKKSKVTNRNNNDEPANLSELEPLKDDEGDEYNADIGNETFASPYNTGTVMGASHAEDPYLLQFMDKKANADTTLIPFVTHGVRVVDRDTAFTVYSRDCECDPAIRSLIDAKYELLEQAVKPFRDQLLALYFRFIDWTYPAVDKRRFYRAYFHAENPLNRGLICSMLGLGCTYWKYSAELCIKPMPKSLTEDLWKMSWNYIEHDVNCSGASLDTVQALLLYIQRRVAGDGIHEQVKNRIHVGMLVSLSFSMGLHLDCSSWMISSIEKASRNRLWALVYYIDKWTAANLGHPSLLCNETSTQQYRFDSEFPQESRFVHLIRLTAILGSILDDLYMADSQSQYSADISQLAELHLSELRTWKASLPGDIANLDTKNEFKFCSNGMIHLSALAVEVLIFRKLIMPTYSGRYRHEAHDLVQRIVNFCLGINHSHLHAFWISTCRLSLSSLAHFVLRYHAQSPTLERTQNTPLMRSWIECLRSLNHGWEEGIGLAYHRMDALFYKGQTTMKLPIMDTQPNELEEAPSASVNTDQDQFLDLEKPLEFEKDIALFESNIDSPIGLEFVDKNLHDMLYELIW